MTGRGIGRGVGRGIPAVTAAPISPAPVVPAAVQVPAVVPPQSSAEIAPAVRAGVGRGTGRGSGIALPSAAFILPTMTSVSHEVLQTPPPISPAVVVGRGLGRGSGPRAAVLLSSGDSASSGVAQVRNLMAYFCGHGDFFRWVFVHVVLLGSLTRSLVGSIDWLIDWLINGMKSQLIVFYYVFPYTLARFQNWTHPITGNVLCISNLWCSRRILMPFNLIGFS